MHVYPTHFVLSSRARFHKQWLASFARSGREQRLLSVGVPAAIIHKWPFHCSSAIFKKSSHRFGLDKNKTRQWRHTSEHIGKVDGHRPRIFQKQRPKNKPYVYIHIRVHVHSYFRFSRTCNEEKSHRLEVVYLLSHNVRNYCKFWNG